ncbi:MAG: DNA repair protein RecN [Clostridiales bacterium]|jgi:DNA repair protein RecN (Recombination protein N)|nr:DNA repair protein RecN [Clostridiales bacterium]
MLLSLHIENIALIKSLSLEFCEGLNVLSGETGAGKSIIIDAISFILGGRADKTLIRYGERAAVVEAVFLCGAENSGVRSFFEENGIEADDNIILRRVMTADNRNECRINGRLVNLSTLKNLTVMLADIYGQNEHQSLLKTATHIAVIDGLSKGITAEKEKLSGIFGEYKAVQKKAAAFGDLAYRERRLDMLKYQIEEIENAKLKEGEEEKLREARIKFSNMGKLTAYVSTAYGLLDGEEVSAGALISRALSAMTSAGELDETAEEISERLSDIKSQLRDVIHDVKDCLNGLNYDEKHADEVEERLDEIKLIKKKYGHNIDAVAAQLNMLKEEYDSLSDSENILTELNRKGQELFEQYVDGAIALSKKRKVAAKTFEEEIKRELSELSMSGTTFKAEFSEDGDADYISANMRADGFDNVEFLISPNAGEPLRPFSKIISGGEMSRFMLALKSIISETDNIGVMIFDEIDTGISGTVAETVAQKLCKISGGKQVLAVTHLPQIAGYADRHFLISKSQSAGKTLTSVECLTRERSIEEIARLSGGADKKTAIPHAVSIKEKGDRFKAALMSQNL